MKRYIVIEIIACACMILFIYAAVIKLLDYEKFRVDIGQSPMLSPFAPTLSVVVPVAELLIVMLLMVVRTRLLGLCAFLAMMVMFTTYIVLASRFSDYVPCSCGGIIGQLGWTAHLIFNLVFVLFALTAILLCSKEPRRILV
ncbi:MAG TPA: MauE/DoxX family redox-associated membrane protein [Ohtaekwangia sp.]